MPIPSLDRVTVTAVRTLAVSPQVRPELLVSGARGTHDRSDFLLVRVETSAGVDGFGEVSATLLWSGEDAVTAEHAISAVLASAIVGRPIVPVADLEARMDAVLAGSAFTKAGVATALWDAYARLLDVPLATALGGPRRTQVPIKCSLSGNGQRLADTHRAAAVAGFGAFKIKVGIELASDIERVAQARDLVGPDTFLGLDANGGYSLAEARRAVKALGEFAPAFLEQPVPAADLAGMSELRSLGLPIIADESVFGMADLIAVLRARAADAVSLYVGKSGGPGRAVAMATVAAAHGLGVLLGSNGELGLGAAAQLHVACAAPELLSDFPSDIIGAFYYDDDVLASPLDSDGRRAVLPDGPGLGVELKPELLARLGISN
ncbi:mandelate racemase/muconate lactonizing enzyme family protein [Nakamurella lactea]|uniref:mandelate racemase/muconate lactonizing enzyme family protein n=1 Tax=Nakamurella lactea TaxID=459515 RepID=UPI000422DCA6|nr:enolase C-terminal domain-like protein [Nakamurella lactea]